MAAATATASAKPNPIVLCLERLADAHEDRFVRCTAKPGRERGLAIGLDGGIRWCDTGPVGCELWVSRDQRLIAYCPQGTPPTVLTRAGRALELPKGKPVVVRNQDELALSGVRFRVHVHGIATEVHAPRVLRGLPRVAAAAAVAMALGSGTSGCLFGAEPDFRDHRAMGMVLPDAGSSPSPASGAAGSSPSPASGAAAFDAGTAVPTQGTAVAAQSNNPAVQPPSFSPEPSGQPYEPDDAGEADVVEVRNSPPL